MGFLVGVACATKRGVIGYQGRVPWHEESWAADELAHFRTLTLGQAQIMGRKTLDSMPKRALEGKVNFVFSRTQLRSSVCEFVPSWHCFRKLEIPYGCVIGGGEIFRLFLLKNALPVVYLTLIEKEYPGNVFFPLHRLENWHRTLIKQAPEYTIYRYENPLLIKQTPKIHHLPS